MISKKFEKQEQENLERYVNKRLADARAKADPRLVTRLFYMLRDSHSYNDYNSNHHEHLLAPYRLA
jgi:hypothetical protein